MTVYIATTKKHFVKILAFMKKQPKDSFPFRCWQLEARQHEANLLNQGFFSRIKEALQGVDVFVCEDDEGNIRVVAFRERRGKEFNPKEPQLALRLRAIPDQGDFESNFRFIKEAVDWATQYDYIEYGIETAIYDIPDMYLDLMQRIYGDALEIIEEIEIPPLSILPELKKIYRAKISFTKYLGVT